MKLAFVVQFFYPISSHRKARETDSKKDKEDVGKMSKEKEGKKPPEKEIVEEDQRFNFSLFRMSDDEEEERLLGRRDLEGDPRFNTLFSRLELEDRWNIRCKNRAGCKLKLSHLCKGI